MLCFALSTVMPARAGATARQSLQAAITRFAAFDKALFASDQPARAAGRPLRPTLRTPHFGRAEGVASLSTALVGGRSRLDIDLFSESRGLLISAPAWETGFSLESALAARSQGLRAVAGAVGGALVVAEAQRKTDYLLRALPYGVSVYVLFQSARALERISFETGLECAPEGFELFRRLGPGTFSWETELTNNNEEAECEPYSHSLVAPGAPPRPTDIAGAYRGERALLASAKLRARRDRARPEIVFRAYTAHDATGRPVLTEMAWREEGSPVIRVHLVSGRFRFPVVLRFDVIAAP